MSVSRADLPCWSDLDSCGGAMAGGGGGPGGGGGGGGPLIVEFKSSIDWQPKFSNTTDYIISHSNTCPFITSQQGSISELFSGNLVKAVTRGPT